MTKSELLTRTSSTTTSQCDFYQPVQRQTSRFLLRTERGFLSASHAADGPPILVVPSPERATAFVDLITAVRRAQALHLLGWRDLRVVEHAISL